MEFIEVHNPATGEVIDRIESFDPRQMSDVLEKARSAQKKWAKLSFKLRGQHLNKGKQYILENQERIVKVISKNNGKPNYEALAHDVLPALSAIHFAQNKIPGILRDRRVGLGWYLANKSNYYAYEPLGIIGIISPWNYPLNTPFTELVFALMCGNAVILKPSEVTGSINLVISEIVHAMQLPEGLFQILHGKADVGAALASSKVDRLIFTGSTSTGKKVMAAAAQNLTPLTLELGGKDCMIVFEDSDLDVASSAALAGGFYNAGQACCSVERILVQNSIYQPFCELLSQKAAKLRQGPSIGFENDLGPVTFEGQKRIYQEQRSEFKKHNLKIIHGNIEYDGKANFHPPLIVEGRPGVSLWDDETFGAVMAIKSFQTEQEAIETHNLSPYGLTAVVYSRDQKRALRVARQLRVGIVTINDGPYMNAVSAAPWGGFRDSGFGKVHGPQGIRDLCRETLISRDLLGQLKQYWWFPYTQRQYLMMKNFILVIVGDGIFLKLKSLIKTVYYFFTMGRRI
ncbi:MAG: aldehyde dehydrogenase family protein [Oligoflexia bacterium]|nr:aldehyde dehydrogenase family protein [Oligoflexia bacterium]